MTLRKLMLALLLAPLLSAPLRAQEGLVTFKSMSVDLALALARAALADCQKQGFQVTVAVVDRFGITQVLLRDRFAGAHTVPTATGKAWTAVSFRTDTSEMIAPTQPGMPQAGVRALPGAVAAGVTDTIPFGWNNSDSVILAEGYEMKPGESVISPQAVDVRYRPSDVVNGKRAVEID